MPERQWETQSDILDALATRPALLPQSFRQLYHLLGVLRSKWRQSTAC